MPRVSLDLVEVGVGAEEAADRRRAERAELIVRVDYATVDEIFSEFTRDINEGGLFIETDKPGPVGGEVTMHFNLPGSSDSIRTVGTIVRTSSGDDSTPPGMGIEFDDLTTEASSRIDAIVRALRTGDSPA
jgi:uncharacterized protein (TIGR02266 family)